MEQNKLVGSYVIIKKDSEDSNEMAVLVLDKNQSLKYPYHDTNYIGIDTSKNFVSFKTKELVRLINQEQYNAYASLNPKSYKLCFITKDGILPKNEKYYNLKDLMLETTLLIKSGFYDEFVNKSSTIVIYKVVNEEENPIKYFDNENACWVDYKQE